MYLAEVMDIWSRRIVGWSVGDRIDARLADDAPGMAVSRRRPADGCPRHSGHGSACGSLPLGKTMRDHGIRPSMGSVEGLWDNAPTLCDASFYPHVPAKPQARALAMAKTCG